MYRLMEYYWTGGIGRATGRTIAEPTTFATLDEARKGTDAAYKEIRRIPESENIVLLVHDTSDRVVYSVPEKPMV